MTSWEISRYLSDADTSDRKSFMWLQTGDSAVLKEIANVWRFEMAVCHAKNEHDATLP